MARDEEFIKSTEQYKWKCNATYILNRCLLHFLEISRRLNFSKATLHIMTISIHLVVVFIVPCVIICLTNFLLATFYAFSWVIVLLIKDFVLLIPPSLGYTSPATLNLMRLTFTLSLAPRPNLFSLLIFQISWNCVFTILINSPYRFFTTHYSIQLLSV